MQEKTIKTIKDRYGDNAQKHFNYLKSLANKANLKNPLYLKFHKEDRESS